MAGFRLHPDSTVVEQALVKAVIYGAASKALQSIPVSVFYLLTTYFLKTFLFIPRTGTLWGSS